MTLQSMTGFGRAEGASSGQRWSWETRSVNARSLDIRLRMPPGYDFLDPTVRKLTGARLSRGAVQVGLHMEAAEGGRDLVEVDEEALDRMIAVAQTLKERIPDAPPVRVEHLLGLKGVLKVQTRKLDDEEQAAFQAALGESLASALDALVEARKQEGARLGPLLHAVVDDIAKLTARAKTLETDRPDKIKARLKAQLEELVSSGEIDPARLAQEAALIAVKADVCEEIDRLTAHVDAAREMLDAGGPCGRRFDFLAQEFNREANTLCAKAADAELKQVGLDLKNAIDRLREQVQNLE